MKLIFWESAIKPHLVSNELVGTVKAEIGKRFGLPPIQEIDKSGSVFRIDRGGSMMGDAEWISTNLEDTVLEVPVRDIEYFFSELAQAQTRVFGGKLYYKMHGWTHCVVLASDQRSVLLKAWTERLREFQDKANKEKAEYAHRIELINQHLSKSSWHGRLDLN
jgi:hypothetical protein